MPHMLYQREFGESGGRAASGWTQAAARKQVVRPGADRRASHLLPAAGTAGQKVTSGRNL
jgi:hypothetical protein